MLRNRNVRTKLIAILLAPALALVVLGGIGVWDRRQTAEDSRNVGQLTALATEITPLVHSLQYERGVTAAYLAGTSKTAADVQAARTATDAAAAELSSRMDDLDTSGRGDSLVATLADARERLDGLADDRADMDGQAMNASTSGFRYGQVISSLLAVNDQIAAETTQAELFTAVSRFTTWSELKELNSQERDLLTTVFAAGGFEVGEYQRFLSLDIEEDVKQDTFDQLSPEPTEVMARQTVAGPAVASAEATHYSVLLGGADGAAGQNADEWFAAQTAMLDQQRQVEVLLADQVASSAARIQSDAEDSVILFAGLAIAAILAALLLASMVARSIVRPLLALTRNAHTVAEEQLPQLVERLRNPNIAADARIQLEPIEVSSYDEIGRLAEAFNSIQTVAVEVATEQAALLRKGIGEMFVNLARRNQSLLDRQISFLDELEAAEEDPDTLEDLFKLDHLATRMRRNAESLLVLAGVEPARRWGKPVDLDEVVRAAIAEVEDYNRVDITVLDRASIVGHAAVDVAHLLSELLENAARMSPPSTTVEVSGRRGERAYMLQVVDRGVGMSGPALDEANELFARPPVVGLALSKSLGFIVIGRLAARLGIGVQLASTPGGGVTAHVLLPVELMAEPDSPVVVAPHGGTIEPVYDDRNDLRGLDLDQTVTFTPAWAELPAPTPAVTEHTEVGLPKRSRVPASDLPAGPPPDLPAPLPSRSPAPAPLSTDAPGPAPRPVEPLVPVASVEAPPLPTRAAAVIAAVEAPPLPTRVPSADPGPAPAPRPTAGGRPAPRGRPVPPAPVGPDGTRRPAPSGITGSHPEALTSQPVRPTVRPPSIEDEEPFRPRFVRPTAEGTDGGLARRRPGASASRDVTAPLLARVPGGSAAPEPALPSWDTPSDLGADEPRRRTPDEMRTLLSRYRSGQERVAT